MFKSFMKKIFAGLLILFINYSLSAQLITDTAVYSLGDSSMMIITLKKLPVEQGIYFLNVHENEQTGIKTATNFVQQNGGNFMYLEHGGERNVSFSFRDTNYIFDPNRIFTADGRRKTLDTSGAFSFNSDSIVESFADSFLNRMPDPELVVALHNNSDENFSIKSYKKGQVYALEASAIYINKKLDADDFILTTDKTVYNFMRKRKVNVVLQDNENCTDDGSLSVYFGKKGISYINIEAEHGHANQQGALLEAVSEWIKTL